MRAARYAGVAPWDLAGIPRGSYFWEFWAMIGAGAEAQATDELQLKAERKAKQSGQGRRR